MKKLVAAVCLIVGACLPATAQTSIELMEYFFDSDPGLGNGVSIPITPGPNQDINLNINTSGLSIGFHTLVVRAKHLSGAWGIPEYKVVYVEPTTVIGDASLNNMEYFVDTDPGVGNGTPITVTGTVVDFNPIIPTGSFTPGFHVLHIRAFDADGTVGIDEIRPFYVVAGGVTTLDDVVSMEYFFDTEPGYGAGTPITVVAGTSVNVPALISSAALTTGFHTIHIRARDDEGQWGIAETRTFYLDETSQVSTLEYYIDTDPGDGNATPVSITTGGTLDHNFTIPTASLSPGNHTIGIRAGLSDGSWGSPRTFSFTVQDSQTITFGTLPSVTFGDAPFTLTGSTSSGLTITYNSSDPLVATISGSTVTVVGAGTTVVTASQAGNTTFGAATDVTQNLVVNKANQAITFSALTSKTVGDAPFTLAATSSSALAVSYGSSDTNVATISGNVVTIVGAGTTIITASQTGNGNYNAASVVAQTLVVQPVVPVNNPPTITASTTTSFFVTASVVVNGTIVVADADNQIASATVSITTGFQAAEDQLSITLQGGIVGAYNAATGVLAISGPASVADYQQVLRTVRYNNTSSTPNTANRTISFRVNDGTTNSNIVTGTVTINKPPAIEAPPRATQAGGNIVFMVDEILSDPDNNLDLSTLKIVSAQGAQITIDGTIITINYSGVAEYMGTDQLTITICDMGGSCRTDIVTVEIGADVQVFNGISSNGDNMNDFFKINFLPSGSRVAVFNRWGDQVFELSLIHI